MKFFEQWQTWLNPEWFIHFEIGGYNLALLLLIALVFAEIGLLLGIFFSRDSLLFLAGMYSSDIIIFWDAGKNESLNVVILALIISSTSVLANLLAYHYGISLRSHKK